MDPDRAALRELIRARGFAMIVVVMGVSGPESRRWASILARQLGWTFVEADDSIHPAANIEKMHCGVPLTDADRLPWLDSIRQRLKQALDRGENVVLACSALKHAYQHYLADHAAESIRYVWLVGSEELIRLNGWPSAKAQLR